MSIHAADLISLHFSSLQPTSLFKTHILACNFNFQALTAPYSLSIIEMFDIGTDATHGAFNLNIGLQNGFLLRTVIDNVTGQSTDTRQRFLGARPVKLIYVRVQMRQQF